VARDRNHPSIIIWSVGNENPVTPLHLALLRAVKGWDPTRPTLMPWHAEEWLPPEIDILAPHYPTTEAADRLTGHADRPVVATEHTHALREEGFGDLADHWLALTRHPAGAGGTIWMWQDQGLRRRRRTPSGEETYIQLHPEGTDGIVRADRAPQRDYWETKAVYAPVTVPVERLEFRPGDPAARLPVRNDYDFTDLGAVGIRWRVFSGERSVNAGETKLAGPPHSTAWLSLPLPSGPALESGGPFYAHISIHAGDGSEINKRGVELTPVEAAQAPGSTPRWPAIRVTKGATLQIAAGGTTYEFDPRSAALTSASRGGRRLVTLGRATIWRPLNEIELSMYRRAKMFLDLPDLNRYTTSVTKWQLATSPDAIRIDAVADHVVDGADSIAAQYRFTVRQDGALLFEYVLRPKIRAPWVPEVGVVFDTASEMKQLRWLGLGPLEAFPNLKEAPVFGLWSEKIESASGMKGEVRWAELRGDGGPRLRVEGAPYVRIESPGKLRVLAKVEGRPTKFRRADRPEHRLDVNEGAQFMGGFCVRLVD
jgi:beta-galactosidase